MTWILFLQEATDPAVLNVTRYATYLNIGTNMLGTAILAMHEFPLTNFITLPSRRAIAADHDVIHLVNVHATSVTARRADRERSFNSELPELFHAACLSMLI